MKKFRIVEKYSHEKGYRVYVQQLAGWWIFKWWRFHNNENSRYHIDSNFRTVGDASDYIVKWLKEDKKPPYKIIHNHPDTQ